MYFVVPEISNDLPCEACRIIRDSVGPSDSWPVCGYAPLGLTVFVVNDINYTKNEALLKHSEMSY